MYGLLTSARFIAGFVLDGKLEFENMYKSKNNMFYLYEASKYDICCVGRSMIEMLGVLAIIAVLSVGGIAGYSKAMDMYKINKYKSGMYELIGGFLQIKDEFGYTKGQYSRGYANQMVFKI